MKQLWFRAVGRFATSSACLRKPRQNFSGLFAPLVTPFNEDESIAWSGLQRNLKKLNDTALAGYLVHGSNGEFCHMSDEERVEVFRAVRQSTSGSGKLILAGSGCESTRHTMDLTEKMADAGADAVVVVTPHFFKASMTHQVLHQHFSAVADSSPIPILLYNVPKNTGVDLQPDLVIDLAKHPNVVGFKDSGGDITKIAQIVAGTRDENFAVLAGSAGFLLAALHVGAVGGVCALANVLPDECSRVKTLKESEKHREAVDLQARLLKPNAAVTAKFGIPGLKQVMDWMGFHGGQVRKPLLPLHPDSHGELKEAFTSSGFSL